MRDAAVAHVRGNSGKRRVVDQAGGSDPVLREAMMTEQAETGQADARRAELVTAARARWAAALTDLVNT
jgi:hypothetical protein